MPGGALLDSVSPRHGQGNRSAPRSDRYVKLLKTTFFIPPFTILSLFVLILSYSLTQTPHVPKRTARAPHEPPTSTAQATQVTPEKPPTLLELLSTVADALDSTNATYWLLPGLGLLPPVSTSFDGRVNPWQEGVDLGVYQSDLMRVILAQSSLQAVGIVPVESYFGLRLFHVAGRGDERYDFRAPFVDVLYFHEDKGHAVSYCCDCMPVTISACTKKTCGCLLCAARTDEVFPLTKVRIEGLRRSVNGPRNRDSLLLPRDLDGVHPGVFNL